MAKTAVEYTVQMKEQGWKLVKEEKTESYMYYTFTNKKTKESVTLSYPELAKWFD